MRELDKAQAYWSHLPDPGLKWKNKKVPDNARYNLARAYYQQGRWNEALAIHGDGYSGWEWFYLVMIQWQLGHNDKALYWYDRSLDWMATIQDKRLRDLQAEVANLLGQRDPYDRSEQAWRLYEEGRTCERQGNAQKAKECFGNVAELYEKLSTEFPGVPAYRVTLVETLAKSGRLEDALRIYRETSAHLEQVEKGAGSSEENRKYSALWCDRWAYCLRDARRFKEAEEVNRRAIALWERLAIDSPRVPEYRFAFAHSLWLRPELLVALGQTSEVESIYRKALAVFEQLVTDFPDVHFYQVETGWCCYAMLGPFLATQSDRRRDAEQVLRRGLAVHEKMIADTPRQDPGIWPRLAGNYDALVNLLKADGRMQDVVNVYRRAIDFYSKLVTDVPDEPAFRITLADFYGKAADAYGKSADLLWEAGQISESEQPARNAVEVLEKLAADYPRNSNYQLELGQSRTRLATIQSSTHAMASARALGHIRLSQWDKAAAEYAKAGLLGQPLREDDFAYACLFLIRGSSEGYNHFCQGMIQARGSRGNTPRPSCWHARAGWRLRVQSTQLEPSSGRTKRSRATNLPGTYMPSDWRSIAPVNSTRL